MHVSTGRGSWSAGVRDLFNGQDGLKNFASGAFYDDHVYGRSQWPMENSETNTSTHPDNSAFKLRGRRPHPISASHK